MSRIDAETASIDASDALLALARLLGRIAAEEAVSQSRLGQSTFIPKHKRDCDGKQ